MENIYPFVTGVLGVNTYVVCLDEKSAFVVDAGGDADKIISFLKEKNLELKACVLTHTHFDHIGAISDLKKQYPKMELFVHESEAIFLGEDALDVQLRYFGITPLDSIIKMCVTPTPAPDKLLNDGQIIFEDSVNFEGGFRVLHTKGHSKGSICLYNKKKAVMFSGDTLFCGSYGRTDLHGGNKTEIMKSLEKILSYPAETIVFPGHDEPTTIGSEKEILRY